MNYQKIYNQIIERAQNRKLEGYKEKHHIIPRCLDGLDDKSNLVELTAREHFLCHRLLCEIYPNNHKLLCALWLMAIGKQKWNNRDPYDVSSREYERIRILFIEKSKTKIITNNHKNQIAKANSKKVIQYDFNGKKINEFISAADAERFINKKLNEHWKNLSNNINDCCRGRQKSAYGYIWKYENCILNLEEHKRSLNKKKWKSKLIY